jgi:hypothetical protein
MRKTIAVFLLAASVASLGFLPLGSYRTCAGASIGVDYCTDANGLTEYLEPNVVVGAVPQAHWNNVSQFYVKNDPGLPLALTDNLGASTGASLHLLGTSFTSTGVAVNGQPAQDFLHAGTYPDANQFLTRAAADVIGIPYASFDVLVYLGPSVPFASASVEIGVSLTWDGQVVTPLASADVTAIDSTSLIDATSPGGGNYVWLRGISSAEFVQPPNIITLFGPPPVFGISITTSSYSTNSFGQITSAPPFVINGFQIVETPEPSTLALAALGFAALVAWPWRRR